MESIWNTLGIKQCYPVAGETDVPISSWYKYSDRCASPSHIPTCMPYLPKCYPTSKSKSDSTLEPIFSRKSFNVSESFIRKDLIYCYSSKVTEDKNPDVVLQCLDSFWELHSQYLLKSKLLLELLTTADESKNKICRNIAKNTTDIHQKGSLFYCNSEDKSCPLQTRKSQTSVHCNQRTQSAQWVLKPQSNISLKQLKNMVNIKLDIEDQHITKEAFAVALGNLYNAELEVDVKYAVSVLTAASILKFPTLFQKCVSVMMNNINSTTVCHFLTAALKYNLDLLMHDCERWLELNLTVHLRYEANFRDLQLDFLHKILLSPRLFTFSEYHVLQTVLCWIFLQMNPKVRIMPSYNGILTYFISLPKTSVFLEKEIGERFLALFKALRLHGITETKHLEELQQINLFPQAWLLQILTHNYHALQHGGDMPFLKDFSTQAIRFGFIITEEPQYYSEMIAHCGFYFELKAVQERKKSIYSFYIQRLKHTDSSLPFRICERYAFSLRQEREIQYAIQVQSLVDERWQVFNSGKQTQKFGVTKKTCHSQVLMIAGLTMPIFVTFALLFPAS
eukprot:gi/632971417/ref/XP_007902162.1/ PREDICTED: BTB/POZ domain-containing protein 16 [Callorhinchus milii]